MRLSLILLACLVIACKPQEKNQQSVDLQTIGEYKPNPDEAVLFLTLLDTEKSETGWVSNAEVKKQINAGFGFKNRLAPGQKISLQSKDEIPKGDFYCAVDYKDAPGGGRYILKSLLRK